MKLLFTLSFLLSTNAAFAAPAVVEGEWINEKFGFVAVEPDSVIVEDKTYNLGKEEIVEAYSVRSGSETICKARTHMATKAATGEIVIVEALRDKVSSFGGVFCGFSKDVNSFGSPYTYTQYVLSSGNGSAIKLKKIQVFGGTGQPEITMDQLKDPNITETNAALKAYVTQEKGKPADPTMQGGFRFGKVVEFDLEERQSRRKKDISPGDQLGDEVYGATGHKSLMTHEAQEKESAQEQEEPANAEFK
jgi:hypothetical protein